MIILERRVAQREVTNVYMMFLFNLGLKVGLCINRVRYYQAQNITVSKETSVNKYTGDWTLLEILNFQTTQNRAPLCYSAFTWENRSLCFKSKACPNTGWQSFCTKGKLVNTLALLGHMFSVATIQLCHLNAKKSYRQNIKIGV